jgi:hypothetical protein
VIASTIKTLPPEAAATAIGSSALGVWAPIVVTLMVSEMDNTDAAPTAITVRTANVKTTTEGEDADVAEDLHHLLLIHNAMSISEVAVTPTHPTDQTKKLEQTNSRNNLAVVELPM